MTKKDIIGILTSLDGIGEAKAKLLYDNGFDSIEKIKKASIEDLTKVKGINEKIADSIKTQINKKHNDTQKNKNEEKEEKIEKKTYSKNRNQREGKRR